jgi:hypothetical protein
MNLTQSKLTKAVALILMASFFQVYVQVSAAQDTALQTPQMVGRLFTSGNREILVDREKSDTGTTILDGATLETPDCTTAIAYIGQLDVITLYNEVRLATNTTVRINYSADKVKVTLKQGCAKLLTKQGVEGTIETPDGKITRASQPDASNRNLAEVCYADATRSTFDPSCLPAAIIWIPAVSGGGFLTALAVSSISTSEGENPSRIAPF